MKRKRKKIEFRVQGFPRYPRKIGASWDCAPSRRRFPRSERHAAGFRVLNVVAAKSPHLEEGTKGWWSFKSKITDRESKIAHHHSRFGGFRGVAQSMSLSFAECTIPDFNKRISAFLSVSSVYFKVQSSGASRLKSAICRLQNSNRIHVIYK